MPGSPVGKTPGSPLRRPGRRPPPPGAPEEDGVSGVVGTKLFKLSKAAGESELSRPGIVGATFLINLLSSLFTLFA